MYITSEQKTALIAAIQANTNLNQKYVDGDLSGLADELNTTATPLFIVYKNSVTKETYTNETSVDASDVSRTFNWAGVGGYIARSQGERDAWQEMFGSTGSVNPSKVNILAAFNDIFSGTGVGAVNNKAHLLALSKRHATILEKIFATGTGTDASPATMVIESPISYTDLIGL